MGLVTIMKGLLVCATKPEWAELKKHFSFTKKELSELVLYEAAGQSFDLLQVGIGPQKAIKAFDQLIKQYKPAWILHFGLSGGLTHSLKVGDCLLAHEIISLEGKLQTKTDYHSALLDYASSQGIPLKVGRHFTSATVINTPTEKHHTHQKYNVESVDMETYPIACKTSEAGIPYYFIRSVFDTAGEDLTFLSQSHTLTAKGDVNALGIASSIVRNPKLIMSLPRFQKQAALAHKNLIPLVLFLVGHLNQPK